MTDGPGVLAGGGAMGALARSLDWSATPLGPVAGWPQSLRTSLSMLLESKFPMLLCWGPDFVQFYNDPFRPILGQTKHPAIGQSARHTFAEAWHIIGPLFDEVMHGRAVGFEDMLVPLDRNGYLEECYFLYSYSPIRAETGDVAAVLVTCTETTPRVLAERRLRTLRDLASRGAQAQDEASAWRHAAEALDAGGADLPFALLYRLEPDGSSAVLAAGQSSAVAPPTVAVSGDRPWPFAQVRDTGAAVLVDDVAARFGPVVGAAWPEAVARALVLPVTRPGLARPYGFLVAGLSPRLALDDRYRDFMLLVADQIATALANARAYEEERRRTEALLELDRQKTAFFSNVSHEFRTPLTLMLGPLEQALAHAPVHLDASNVEVVHRNAIRLLRLVNTLLDFSRIEAGRAEPAFEPVDLAVATREIASAFESLVQQAGLAFHVDCPALSGPVLVDRAMWEKVVLNLLSNAYKFTREGHITVRLRDSDGRIVLQVQDTGAGIPAEHLPRVFDRFHRVEGTPARTFEGSGIGLALVRELVQMHEGEVTVDSTPGKGSTFTVVLPARAKRSLVPAAASRDGADLARPYLVEAARWSTNGQPPASPPPHAAADPATRILVVDDNADMREYLQRLLGAEWTIDLARNGREALERLADSPPDLILTDVMMPEVDGLELLRRVRADAATAMLPIIMLSARSGEESRVEGIAAGADDYVIKPFSARELVARIRTHLEISRLRRETDVQNSRLRTLVEVAPAAIAVLRGPDHVFELANERCLALVGHRDIVGRPGREALPELTARGIWELMDQVYASGERYVAQDLPVRVERGGTGRPADGYFSFVLQPLTSANGQTEGILIHAMEVTDQVFVRRALDDARQSAEAANRAKDQFLAMLGHELRNPLAPILTALQLMAMRGDIGAEKERAIIERQVRHVVRLVDDLLDVSRIARGRIELKRAPVEMAAVVAKAVEMSSPVIEEKQHVLELDVPRKGLVVDADPTRLEQVVFNLLNNAAKYTEPRGRIVVTAAPREGSIELRIRDSGIGIDAAMLPHVFDLFVQDHQALDRSQGGLGLGLAIVRNLVELHGGQVSASSRGPGHGSEFVVSLPAGTSRQPARKANVVEAAPSDGGARMRVLVVDDNADASQMLAEALAIEGFECRTASDGPAALRAVDEFAPQVALLDLGLPVMDGYELAAQLRQRPDAPRLIAVTGYGAAADHERSTAAGFAEHLVKPVDVEAVVQSVRRLGTSSNNP